MSIDQDHRLSPAYSADLRRLIDRAFMNPAPVPAAPVPHGTIQERILAQAPTGRPLRVAGPGIDPAGAPEDEISITTAEEYWALALPHHLVVLGPLLVLARLDLDSAERLRAERQLLDVYDRLYHGVPLPPEILAALRERTETAPAERLPTWVDAARGRIMDVDTVDDAAAVRIELRLEALRAGATGMWQERTVAVAEVMTDILLLCRSAREDVESAAHLSGQFGDSAALALQSLDGDGEFQFERVLSTLVRPPLSATDVPEEERERIIRFARNRSPFWRGGLFDPPAVRTEMKVLRLRQSESTRTISPPARAVGEETARDSYMRIRRYLEDHLLGRPELCRDLALTGTAHLQGVTHQRVLLVGITGSGKTHAARALARALDRPYLQIDMADITGTGWKGKDIPDVLDALAGRADSRLMVRSSTSTRSTKSETVRAPRATLLRPS